jgi:hypothetical protein
LGKFILSSGLLQLMLRKGKPIYVLSADMATFHSKHNSAKFEESAGIHSAFHIETVRQ